MHRCEEVEQLRREYPRSEWLDDADDRQTPLAIGQSQDGFEQSRLTGAVRSD